MPRKTQKKDMSTENAIKDNVGKTTKDEPEEKIQKRYLIPEKLIWGYTGPKWAPVKQRRLAPGKLYEIKYEQEKFIGIEDDLYVIIAEGGYLINDV